jgi:hypothetical protein
MGMPWEFSWKLAATSIRRRCGGERVSFEVPKQTSASEVVTEEHWHADRFPRARQILF